MDEEPILNLEAPTTRLSAEDVERAIYVDYEGNANRVPTLLGWRIDGIHFGAIVEPLFSPCSNRHHAKGIWTQEHRPLVEHLIGRAEREGRFIVSWSEHDWREMMAALDDSKWQLRLNEVYRNAIQTARPWYYRTLDQVPPEASLAHLLETVGRPHPKRYGQGVVGSNLDMLRRQWETGKGYADLTRRMKDRWVQVVKHNRLDLQGMETVLRIATGLGLRESS